MRRGRRCARDAGRTAGGGRTSAHKNSSDMCTTAILQYIYPRTMYEVHMYIVLCAHVYYVHVYKYCVRHTVYCALCTKHHVRGSTQHYLLPTCTRCHVHILLLPSILCTCTVYSTRYEVRGNMYIVPMYYVLCTFRSTCAHTPYLYVHSTYVHIVP